MNETAKFEVTIIGLGYIGPHDRLADRHSVIFAARAKKLETNREIRKKGRKQPTSLVV